MRVLCNRVPRLSRCTLLLAVVLTLSTLLFGHYYTAEDPRMTTWGRSSGPLLDVLHLGHKSVPELAGRVSAASKRQKNLPQLWQQVKANVSEEKPSSRCINSVQSKINKDSHFGSIFDTTVPVLMWDKHFTSWDQLEKKNPPYGWKGLPKSVIASTLKLLNHTANSWLFDANPKDGCVRCAVVGNGGILNGSRQGKAIDDHDFVFRLNGAVIKGFEEDVGTKTSFYGFTVNTMKNSLIAYDMFGFTKVPQSKDLRYIFVPSDLRDYLMLKSAILGVAVPEGYDKDDRPSDYFGPEASSNKFKFLHPHFLSYLTERFLKSDLLNTEFGYLYMPSTGALMLLTALHTCDQVSAYGFITENYQNFSDHYYEREKKPLLFYANHDMLMEAVLWKSMHQRGLLWLYQR